MAQGIREMVPAFVYEHTIVQNLGLYGTLYLCKKSDRRQIECRQEDEHTPQPIEARPVAVTFSGVLEPLPSPDV